MAGNRIRTSRGKLIGQNGPGSLYVDTEGVSYLVSAADKWYTDYDESTKEFELNDTRLEQFLGVDSFREVPFFREKNYSIQGRPKISRLCCERGVRRLSLV